MMCILVLADKGFKADIINLFMGLKEEMIIISKHMKNPAKK